MPKPKPPLEIEIKMHLPDGGERIAEQSELIQRFAGSGVSKPLESVYFDTHDLTLYRQKVALRIRRVGDRRIQTLKSAARAHAFARREWEADVSDDVPNPALIGDTTLAQMIAVLQSESLLHPLFETRISRMAWQADLDGARAEVALDRGKVVAGEREESISEIEVELVEGSFLPVLGFSLALATQLDLQSEPRSKAERGYALAGSPAPTPNTGGKQKKGKKQSLRQALVTTIRAFTANALRDAHSAAAGDDPDALKGLRSGLRRLRVRLTVFQPLLPENRIDGLIDEIRWAGDALGSYRDWDVFLFETCAALSADLRGAVPMGPFCDAVRSRRDEARLAAGEILRGSRFFRLVLALELFAARLEEPGGRDLDPLILAHLPAFAAPLGQRLTPDASARLDRPLRTLGAKGLEERCRKLLHAIEDLDPADDKGMHKLRLAVKRMRYAAEVFLGVFDEGRSGKAFLRAVRELQDVLGAFNDLSEAETALNGLDPAMASAEARAAAIGWIRARRSALIEGKGSPLRRAARALERSERFWS